MTGLSVISTSQVKSYNHSVNTINQWQRSNVRKLETALQNANSTNDNIAVAANYLETSINNLKSSIFINQALCDNYDICEIWQCGTSQTSGNGLSAVPKFRMDILS